MNSPEKQRILIADDAEEVTTLLITALEIAGYDVVVATDGQMAFDLGTESDIDLAIIDQLMPGLLGIEIIQKWQEKGLDFPVIVLSGVEDDDVVVGSLDSGASDFIRKPFRLPELMARVKRLLN